MKNTNDKFNHKINNIKQTTPIIDYKHKRKQNEDKMFISEYFSIIHPNDECLRTIECAIYYNHKNTICSRFCKGRLAEIGVRFGYSAWAFLSSGSVNYYQGFDIINGGHGGVGYNTFPYVQTMLNNKFPKLQIELTHLDTQNISKLPGSFDFIHIDGDHSFNGCTHDINMAINSLNKNGVILIDDYDFLYEVRKATDNWLYNNKSLYKRSSYEHSWRGEMIIET